MEDADKEEWFLEDAGEDGGGGGGGGGAGAMEVDEEGPTDAPEAAEVSDGGSDSDD